MSSAATHRATHSPTTSRLPDAQPQYRELRTWLAFLAQDAAVKIGERLIRSGVFRARDPSQAARSETPTCR